MAQPPPHTAPGGAPLDHHRDPSTLGVDDDPRHRPRPRADGPPARAHRLLLPHAGLGRGGRGRRAGDPRAGLEGHRPLRGPLVGAVVALPDRRQRVHRHAPRPAAPGPPDGPRARRPPSRRRCSRRRPRTPSCSRSPTSASSPSTATRPTWRRPASRSGSPSSPPCSTCRPASGPCSSSARCSSGRPPRWPTCSRRAWRR